MRRLAQVMTVLAALVGGMAAAQEPLSSADGSAIRRIIEQQLDAFRRDDGNRAFGFASPTIRAVFHDPDTFMRMVRAGYPQVYRPREVEFRTLGYEDGAWTQRVLLVGPDGVPVIARYLMQRQPDGTWLINGCILERAADQTT